MERLASLLLLFLLSLVEVHCQQTFPYVSFMGQTLVNHSYVDLSTVVMVQCHTDLRTCCSSAQGIRRGDWYFPNGTRLPLFTAYRIPFGETRTAQKVDIRRDNSSAQTGIYRCDIPTEAVYEISVREIVYVGLYFTGGNEVCYTFSYLYSGTSLIRTPMGQIKVSSLVRCPHFRGLNACKSGTWGGKKLSCLERCPHFRGGVPLYKQSKKVTRFLACKNVRLLFNIYR